MHERFPRVWPHATGRRIPANVTARIMALRAAHRFAHANALLSEWEVN